MSYMENPLRSELQAMADVIKARPRLFPTTPHRAFAAPSFDSVARDSGRPSYGMSCMNCGDERHFDTLCKRCAGGAA